MTVMDERGLAMREGLQWGARKCAVVVGMLLLLLFCCCRRRAILVDVLFLPPGYSHRTRTRRSDRLKTGPAPAVLCAPHATKNVELPSRAPAYYARSHGIDVTLSTVVISYLTFYGQSGGLSLALVDLPSHMASVVSEASLCGRVSDFALELLLCRSWEGGGVSFLYARTGMGILMRGGGKWLAFISSHPYGLIVVNNSDVFDRKRERLEIGVRTHGHIYCLHQTDYYYHMIDSAWVHSAMISLGESCRCLEVVNRAAEVKEMQRITDVSPHSTLPVISLSPAVLVTVTSAVTITTSPSSHTL